MSENTPKSQRWYDKRPELSRSVALLIAFPHEMQTIIGEGIVVLAEKEFQANEILKSFKSLGTDKVLGLYKSKNKKRSYDNNPMLHKAMNYLYVLSDDNQDFMAHQILEVIGYIEEYMQSCKTFEVKPHMGDVSAITTNFVESGSEEAKKFLKAFQANFLNNIKRAPGIAAEASPKSNAPQHTYNVRENILDDSQGMRLRLDP